jgi:hypothetical protein
VEADGPNYDVRPVEKGFVNSLNRRAPGVFRERRPGFDSRDHGRLRTNAELEPDTTLASGCRNLDDAVLNGSSPLEPAHQHF